LVRTNVSEFQIHPNPSDGVIHVKNSTESDYNTTIIGLIGKIGYENNISGLWKTLVLSFSPKGIYLVNCENQILSQTHRVIIK
jgi:hypothetical protein|tara:strand:- start:3607 stop:3855 length:249 start_codon:yes stop_codon:yes gene_type:complete